MDGLSAVTARVQQIQGLVQSMSGARPTVSVLGSPVLPGQAVTGPTSSGSSGAAGSTGTTSGAAGLSFEAAMARATGAAGASGAAGAGVPGSGAAGASRAVNAAGVPVELARFGNGKVPAEALASIGVGNHRLWGPAAEAFGQLRAAAKAAGVTIGVTDSYRSYEAQVDVARRKGLYKDGGLAAVPGTSQHGWGMALDLDLDSRAQSWMRTNAGRFGFVEDVPREPWHWAFTP